MDLGLKGKVALITGASKGIGKAVAEEFAREGSHVSICARGEDELEEVKAELCQYGVTVVATPADVTQVDDIQQVVDETIKQLGQIDILVNNAGNAWLGRTVNSTDDEWQHCMDVNLYSAVRFTRSVVPYMRKQGWGRIVNVSSVNGHTPPPIMVDYNSAKAAMMAFSKTMSFELAPDNILVNVVCPGGTHTPLWDRLADGLVPFMGETREEVLQNMANNMTLKRFGRAEEIAAVVVFVASERASFITGSVYDVDGGVQKSI